MFDEQREARVARALCEADGQDPEAQVTIGQQEFVFSDGSLHRQGYVLAAAWTNYVGEARRMMAAARAMGLVHEVRHRAKFKARKFHRKLEPF